MNLGEVASQRSGDELIIDVARHKALPYPDGAGLSVAGSHSGEQRGKGTMGREGVGPLPYLCAVFLTGGPSTTLTADHPALRGAGQPRKRTAG